MCLISQWLPNMKEDEKKIDIGTLYYEKCNKEKCSDDILLPHNI